MDLDNSLSLEYLPSLVLASPWELANSPCFLAQDISQDLEFWEHLEVKCQGNTSITHRLGLGLLNLSLAINGALLKIRT